MLLNWPRPTKSALAALSLLPLSGCFQASAPLTVPVPIPPLQPAARQPTPDPLCVPTCLEGLERLLNELQPKPAGTGLRAPSARPTTKPQSGP